MTDEQAFNEINTVRNMYDTRTTLDQWDAMILGLGYILMNEELSETAKTLMEATLFETGYRRMWIELMRVDDPVVKKVS